VVRLSSSAQVVEEGDRVTVVSIGPAAMVEGGDGGRPGKGKLAAALVVNP